MAACLRFVFNSFRNTAVRKGDLSRTIFGLKSRLVPKTPYGFSLEEFKVFYSFPGIRIASMICSAKYLKTAAFGAVSLVSYVTYKKEIISAHTCAMIVSTGVYCTTAMFATAFICNRLIGKMYTNKARTEVVLAYINSKGQRINNTFKTSELKLCDHPNFIARKYVKQIICSKNDLKCNLYNGQGVVLDFMVFAKIFPDYS